MSDVNTEINDEKESGEQKEVCNVTTGSETKNVDDILSVQHRLTLIKTQILAKLTKNPKSAPFRQPVDAKALGIYPIYHEIIKRPSDLSTVKKRIEKGFYKSRQDCLDDIELIWSNAMTFNVPTHFVHEAAKIMQQVTKEKLAKLEEEERQGMWNPEKMEAERQRKRLSKQTGDGFGGEGERKLGRSTARKVTYSSFDGDDDFDIDIPPSAAPKPRTPSAVSTTPKPVTHVSVTKSTPIATTPKSTHMPTSTKTVHHSAAKKETTPKSAKNKHLDKCATIINDLIEGSVHHAYSEPFISNAAILPSDARSVVNDRMTLERIRWRLQTSTYGHPVQVANDVRRIAQQTYRMFQASKSDDQLQTDPPRLIGQVTRLMSAFEMAYATCIDCDQPSSDVETDLSHAPLDLDDDLDSDRQLLIKQLKTAKEQMRQIQESMDGLHRDLRIVRRAEKGLPLPLEAYEDTQPVTSGHETPGQWSQSGVQGHKKRKRSNIDGAQGQGQKKRKGSISQARSSDGNSSQNYQPGNSLTHEASLLLRQQVLRLTEEEQQEVVHIMLNNKETLTTDASGYTEIDLSVCSAKTVTEVQRYVASLAKKVK